MARRPPLPPNRTGGFPASGSPVDGVSARESTLFARSPRPLSIQQHHPSHMRLAESPAAQPSRALAAACWLSSGPASFHLPAPPSLHDHYSFHRYYGGSDFVSGGSSASERHEHRGSQADLPDSCAESSSRSVSNHLWSVRRWRGISPFRSADARGFSLRDRLRTALAGSPISTDRIEFTLFIFTDERRYGLAVLVPLLPTSCFHDAVTVRCRTILHRTEADSHRFDPAPSQAHERGVHAASAFHCRIAARNQPARLR